MTKDNIQKAKNLISSMFEQHGAVCLLVDPASGRIIHANNKALKFYGYSLGALCKLSIYDINTLPKEELYSKIQEVLQKPEVCYNFIHKLADGGVRNVQVQTGPIKVEEKTYIFSIINDITDQLKNKELLEINERRLQNALDASHEGYFEILIDSEGKDSYFFSSRWYQLLGYQNNEFSMDYNVFVDMIHPDDQEEKVHYFKTLSKTKNKFRLDLRIRTKGGFYRWVEISVKILKYTSDFDPLHIVGTMADLHYRKIAEQALEESRERYRKMSNLSFEGILVYDEELIIDLNYSFVLMSGYEREELLGNSISDFFSLPKHSTKDVMKILLKEKSQAEFLLKKKNGEQIYIEVDNRKVVYSNETYNVISVKDINRRKIAENELVKHQSIIQNIQDGIAAKYGETFFNTITKNLNNSLNADITFVGTIDKMSTFVPLAYYTKQNKNWKSYAIKNTAIEVLLANDKLSISKKVVEKFPNDPILQAYSASSFLGISLRDEDNRLIGVLFSVFKNEIVNIKQAEDLLTLFSVRIRTEIERLNVSQQLVESEQQYRELFNRMVSGFAYHRMIYDIDGKPTDYEYIDVNPAFEQLTGLKREQVIGKTVLSILPMTESYWIEKFGNVAYSGIPLVFENYSAALGKYYQVHAYSPKKNYFAVIFNDVTEQRQSIEKIRQSEERLALALEASSDGIFDYDLTNNHFFVSQQLSTMLKHENKNALSNVDSYLNSIFIEDRPIMVKILNKIKEGTEESYSHELRFITQQGDFKWILVRGKVVAYNENHEAIRISGTHVDIDERKKMEEVLRYNEELFKQMAENISESFWIRDFQSRKVIYTSPKFDALFEEHAKILSDEPGRIIEVIHPHDAERIRIALDKLFNNFEPVNESFRIVTRKNGTKWILLRTYFVYIRRKVARIIVFAQDITIQREMEQQTLNAIVEVEEREKKAFASDLHDELGPYLSGIKLYINELDIEEESSNRKILVKNLKEMIDESIFKTKALSNKMMPNILNDFGLAKAVESYCNKIIVTGTIQITLKGFETIGRISPALEAILYRLNIELVNNTLKHAKAKSIHIKLERTNNLLNYEYIDDGVGMNLEQALIEKRGYGLVNIQSRMESIRATYSIKTSLGNGFKLLATIDDSIFS